MIKEDFVNYETAKLLKEKGFDGECETSYYISNEGCENAVSVGDFTKVRPWREALIAAPTHQMAMKWLREVHGLSVETFSIKGTSNICPVFWKSNVVKLLTQDRAFNGELVNSYEEAVEAALKYSLENLI